MFMHMFIKNFICISINHNSSFICQHLIIIQKQSLKLIQNCYKYLFIMENDKTKLFLKESDDIESRIIILKRRAAEADILREERDLLVNMLKLYNPDLIWPETGINKCLQMPTDQEMQKIQELNDQLKFENDELVEQKKQLIAMNGNLKMDIGHLQSKLEDLENDVKEKQSLIEENKNLQESMQNMKIIVDERNQLLTEKKQLSEDLDQILKIAGSNDANSGYKTFIKKLCTRINKLGKEKLDIQNSLYGKDIQIDILNGKISQLNAKLNEPFIAARIKLSMGIELSNEEAYMWAIHNFELTNKKMNAELVKITEQLDLVATKYLNVRKSIKLGKILINKPSNKSETEDLNITSSQLHHKLMELHESTFKDFQGYLDEEDINERSEMGSTAPVSRNLSFQSMFEQHTYTTTSRKLEMLRESAHMVEKMYYKILEIKDMVKEMEAAKRTSHRQFFSIVMPQTPSKLLPRTSIIVQ